LNETSSTETEIQVDDRIVSAPWIKIKTKTGLKGWAWKGFLEKVYQYENTKEKISFKYPESASFEQKIIYASDNRVNKMSNYWINIKFLNNYYTNPQYEDFDPTRLFPFLEKTIKLKKYGARRGYNYTNNEGDALFKQYLNVIKSNGTKVQLTVDGPSFFIAYAEPEFFGLYDIDREFMKLISDDIDSNKFKIIFSNELLTDNKYLNKNKLYDPETSNFIWYSIKKYNGLDYAAYLRFTTKDINELYTKLLKHKANDPIQYWWDMFDYIISTIEIED